MKDQADKNPSSLPGPPGIFLCGMDPAVAGPPLKALAEEAGFGTPPLVYCTREMLSLTLEEALTTPGGEPAPPDQLPPVCLFSGLPLESLHPFLEKFHATGLVRPIFATTTENNLQFSVKELLRHLLEERRAQQAGRGRPAES